MQRHRIVKDMVIECEKTDNRADSVRAALTEIAMHFDVARPIWLPKNEADLQQFVSTQFFLDQFMESVDFDSLVIEVFDDTAS